MHYILHLVWNIVVTDVNRLYECFIGAFMKQSSNHKLALINTVSKGKIFYGYFICNRF